jgi:hypothetical protein
MMAISVIFKITVLGKQSPIFGRTFAQSVHPVAKSKYFRSFSYKLQVTSTRGVVIVYEFFFQNTLATLGDVCSSRS